MKTLTLAFAAASLTLTTAAMAENPGSAMKAEHAMKMESHDKMSGRMSDEKKDAMKPMTMKQTDKEPMNAMSMKGDMAMKPDMKH